MKSADPRGNLYRFLMGALIALINLYFGLQIRLPGARLQLAVEVR